jgi:hypothetical protein
MIIIKISVPLERAIVAKEQFNNWYKLRTYYMAVTISSIPVQVSDVFTMKENVFSHKLWYPIYIRMKEALPRCRIYIPRYHQSGLSHFQNTDKETNKKFQAGFKAFLFHRISVL